MNQKKKKKNRALINSTIVVLKINLCIIKPRKSLVVDEELKKEVATIDIQF